LEPQLVGPRWQGPGLDRRGPGLPGPAEGQRGHSAVPADFDLRPDAWRFETPRRSPPRFPGMHFAARTSGEIRVPGAMPTSAWAWTGCPQPDMSTQTWACHPHRRLTALCGTRKVVEFSEESRRFPID